MASDEADQAPVTRDDEFDTDVLVVGAGPVGLVLACALTHHGVRTRVVERRDEPRRDSLANNLLSRPQELLVAIGVREVLAADASPAERAHVLLGGRPLDTIRFDRVASPHPTVLYSSQAVIERRLREVLTDRGARVEEGTTLTALEQDADGVRATLSVQQGDHGAVEQRVLRCRYLVGADGVRSTVRDLLGIEVPTHTFEGRATRQIDATLSWRRPTEPDSVWFSTYRHGFAGVLPVSGGRHRLFFLEDDAGVPDRDPTLEEMRARARQVTGDPTVTLSDPAWTSHGRFTHGVASAHADRRVFLVGDAGHLNLPIGGQGMNAGLHDAVGLAWRLAMTLAGTGGDPVLGSYAIERHGEHVRLDEQQATGFRRLMYRSRIQDAALRVAAGAVPGLGARLFGAEDLQQLSVGYPDSPLTEDHLPTRTRVHRSAVTAGRRAPDARVALADGTGTPLFDHIYNPDGHTWGWCLLAFDGRDRGARAALDRALDAAGPHPWVHPRLVLAAPRADESAGPATCLFDLDGVAHGAYGLQRTPALVLVRPDGHVAFRSSAGSADQLAAFCAAVTRTAA